MTSTSRTPAAAAYRLGSILLVAGGLTALAFDIDGGAWRGNSGSHTVLETIATLLALVTGLVALVRFYSAKSSTFLFVGVGFVGTAFLDGYHAVVTSEPFAALFPSPPVSLIPCTPWSWGASRTFLAIVLVIGWWSRRRFEKHGRTTHVSELRVFLLVGCLTLLSLTVFAFAPLPVAYWPEGTLGRPQEIIPALLLAVAFAGYLHDRAWRNDAFEYWLLLSIAIGFVSQAFVMARSHALFDSMFDLAHILKIVSYACVFVGSLVNMHRLFRATDTSGASLATFNAQLRAENERRRQTEEALRVAKETAESATVAKSRFLANMSHEIRTPMTAILGFAEELIEGRLSEKDRIDTTRIVVENGRYLLGLINDILDISKIEAGKLEVETLPTSPIAILRAVVRLMEPRATEKGLRFEVEYAGALPETIVSDPTRLRQILINLVGNAIKFTESGEITVRVALRRSGAQPPHIEFAIADSGIGLSDEQRETLFQPFVQADATTTRRFGGTGLGLSISKRLAKLLGGDIVVESTPGVGTTFRVDVPTGEISGVRLIDVTELAERTAAAGESRSACDATSSDDSTASPASDVATRTTRGAARSIRVLVADDTEMNQKLVRRILERSGMTVDLAHDGEQAVQAVLASMEPDTAYDVVLMDMQMPVLDGLEATRYLRLHGCMLPIIALTASCMPADRARCLDAGCTDFVMKPIDRVGLIETIREHTSAACAVQTSGD